MRWMGLECAAVLGMALMGGAGRSRAQGTGAGTLPGLPPANSSNSRLPTLGGGGNDPFSSGRPGGGPSAAQEKASIARNDERQRKLVADTVQLLDLATKLKEEVDKTDKYTLSIDVVKRTAEIERLAKAIRERMKD